MFLLIFPRLVAEFFLDLVYFPLWWYTGGLLHALESAKNLWLSGNALLSPQLWLKNIFVPMFGQHDLQGRLVSFVVRLGNVIFRGFGLLVWTFVVLAVLLLWVLIPLGVGYMLIIAVAT